MTSKIEKNITICSTVSLVILEKIEKQKINLI